MNKPQKFRLPPRADSVAGVDRWVTGGSAAATVRPNGTVTRLAFDRTTAPSPLPQFPFMFGIAALLAAQRRNVEAATAVNRVVLEAAQSVGWRNVRFLQRAIDGMVECLQAMGNPEVPADRAMRQTETVINAYEDASSHMRDVGAMIQVANSEAIEVATRRFTEAADEVKSLARHAAIIWVTETKPAAF
jgi:phasin family protein